MRILIILLMLILSGKAEAAWLTYYLSDLRVIGLNTVREPAPVAGVGVLVVADNFTFPNVNSCVGQPQWFRITQLSPLQLAVRELTPGNVIQCFDGEEVPNAAAALAIRNLLNSASCTANTPAELNDLIDPTTLAQFKAVYKARELCQAVRERRLR